MRGFPKRIKRSSASQEVWLGLITKKYGRALVIDTACSIAGTEAVRMLNERKLVTSAHLSPVGDAAASHYLAAASARLVGTSDSPFALTPADLSVALTEPSLVQTLNEMVNCESDGMFEDEAMVGVSHACGLQASAVHLPWLHSALLPHIVLHDNVIAPAELQRLLASSLSTYVDGPAQLHICIVRDSTSCFVCAWQLSLAFLNQLRNTAHATAQQFVHPAAAPPPLPQTPDRPSTSTAHSRALAAAAAATR